MLKRLLRRRPVRPLTPGRVVFRLAAVPLAAFLAVIVLIGFLAPDALHPANCVVDCTLTVSNAH